MKPYQQLYRILAIIFGFLCFWNLVLMTGSAISSAWSHTPALVWYSFIAWIGAIIVSMIWRSATTGVDYQRSAKILLIALVGSLLPTVTTVIDPVIIGSYIPSWEAKHCTRYAEDIQLNLNAVCDNGDRVFIPADPKDLKRIWENGVDHAHYPYSLLY